MAFIRCEQFCRLNYDSCLTYEELHEREAALLPEIQALLDHHEAQMVDITPASDCLHVQWAFADIDPRRFAEICAGLARLCVHGVRGRLLAIDKEGSEQLFCALEDGKGTLTRFALPDPVDPSAE